jgi:transposase
MKQRQDQRLTIPNLTIGIDLGDQRSRFCVVDAGAEVVEKGWTAMTREAVSSCLARYPGARVVMEVGTPSPWVSRVSEALGHETFVANPSELYGRKRRKRRNDDLDAEQLARLGRADPALLSPIQHRGEQAQADLAVLQSRDMVVKQRSALISHVRSSVKAIGERLSDCSPEVFARRMEEQIPEQLRPALEPVLEQIASMTEAIKRYERGNQKRIEERYPEAERLQQIKGVGPLTALAYVLVIEDPKRFRSARSVGAYLGLVPRLDDSGDADPQLRITKAGSELARRYLVQAAHYILGPFGPDTDLRRWGLNLAARGGKNAKKRATVAVARKLSVLLHRLWTTGAEYEPLRNARKREAAGAAGAAGAGQTRPERSTIAKEERTPVLA